MIQFINGLPEQAYHAARDALIAQGFNNESFFNNYRFSYREKQIEKIDSVVFAPNLPRNAEHACFTIYQVNEVDSIPSLVSSTLANTTAPFHLIHHNHQFDFMISQANGKITARAIEQNISYDNILCLLNDYAIDLKPQKIVEVKQGRTQFTSKPFLNINPLQLSFLTTEVTGKLLAEYFGSAIDNLRDSKIPDPNKMAIQLLGATVLADMGVFGNNPDSSSELITLAHQNFNQYFDKQFFEKYEEVTSKAYTLLRQISYASFVPSMLTEIYKQAYPKEVRKELGRFDTPLYLTRRIWDNIPVEFLRPEQRVAIDMTCGWGSFLIAGHERLSRLSDMRGTKLNQYLHGNDNNSFTANLAKLGLLLSTHQDSWHIDAEHALKWDWLQHHQPNVIVGNPPFLGDGNKSTAQSEGQRTEKANQFFQYAIERLADGGYLAMLMPRTLTSNPASYNLRKLLLKTCDVFELWEIPKDMFEASVRTCVVFARKRIKNETRPILPVQIRTIQPITTTEFRELGTFTHSQLVNNQTDWNENSHRAKKGSRPKNTHVMEYQLILTMDKWNTIHTQCQELQKIAIIFIGAEKGSYTGKHPFTSEYPKSVNMLSDASAVLEKDFIILYDNQPKQILQYPYDFSRPRPEHETILLGAKTILTSNHDPSWGQRVRVAIERKGYCVSDNFWCVSPKPSFQGKNITHEVIAAVLHWKVANAWIIEHMHSPKLPGYAIKTIPFPPLTITECKNLKDNVERIETAAQKNDELAISEAQFNIDVILKQAYQLDEETFERLCRVYYWDKPNHPYFKWLCQQYEWKPNPITLDQQPDSEAWWEISGITEEIYPERGEIKLWLDGWRDFETVPIVDFMPGWLLRPNVAFRTTIPRQCVRERNLKNVSWGKFYPKEYTYMSEEELFADLTNFFYPDDSEHEA